MPARTPQSHQRKPDRELLCGRRVRSPQLIVDDAVAALRRARVLAAAPMIERIALRQSLHSLPFALLDALWTEARNADDAGLILRVALEFRRRAERVQ